MLQITVNGLAGPRCSVEAPLDWTVHQVQEAIAQKIGVPAARQILLLGTIELQPEALVSCLTDAPAPVEVALTLLEDPVTPAEMFEAFEAATGIRVDTDPPGKAQAVNRLCNLVERCRPKTLNALFPSQYYFQGLSVLQAAVFAGNPGQYDPMALAVLQRSDFSLVNYKPGQGNTWVARAFHFPGLEDGTVLHLAAARGRTEICRAIVERDDFVELDARWSGSRDARANGWCKVDLQAGETAAELALRSGYHEIHEMLVAAQAARLD